jgi:hypothetical protein
MTKVLGGLAAIALLFTLVLPTLATKSDKVYVCHAAGQADQPANWVTLYVPATESGYPQGHFTEQGTQEAGHEQDYLGPCEGDTPSASPSSSPTSEPSSVPPPPPTASPSDSPGPSESVTPEPTPRPTGTPTSRPVPTPPATDTEG